jgi:hypothetical protein
MLDIVDEELATIPATQYTTHRRGGSSHGMNAAASIGSLNGVAAADNSKGQSFSVEADSFGYMEMLLESLAALGQLSYAIEVIAQRMAGELHAMVESVIDEVEERYVSHHDCMVIHSHNLSITGATFDKWSPNTSKVDLRARRSLPTEPR